MNLLGASFAQDDSSELMNEQKISDLTVTEFQALVKATVQEAMAEVLIEINAIAEAEATLEAEAEMTEYLKNSMRGMADDMFFSAPHFDD
ncbi:MAG: hypothetical protein AAFQ07_17155 [Chloroflexota bacterium]